MNALGCQRPGLRLVCLTAGAVLLAVASDASIAQRIYKCKNSDGGHSYLQTPCPSESSTVNVRAYTPVPNSPRPAYRQRPARSTAAETWTAGTPTYRPSAPSRQAQAERKRLLSDIDAQISRVGRPNSRGERAMVADLMRLRGQVVTGSAVTGAQSPGYSVPAQAYRAPTPTRVTDQHGRTYEQPPGSTFVTDTQTGKVCFKNGDFIHCD